MNQSKVQQKTISKYMLKLYSTHHPAYDTTGRTTISSDFRYPDMPHTAPATMKSQSTHMTS